MTEFFLKFPISSIFNIQNREMRSVERWAVFIPSLSGAGNLMKASNREDEPVISLSTEGHSLSPHLGESYTLSVKALG